MIALVAVSGAHAQVRHKLVLRRLHTGWCPARCFTAAMQDSLRKVRHGWMYGHLLGHISIHKPNCTSGLFLLAALGRKHLLVA